MEEYEILNPYSLSLGNAIGLNNIVRPFVDVYVALISVLGGINQA